MDAGGQKGDRDASRSEERESAPSGEKMTLRSAASHGLPTLAVLSFLFLSLQACEPNSSHHVDDAALAPRLLDDGAEIEAYLEAFPYQDYKIHDVPMLGRFYLDENPPGVKKRLRSGKRWEEHVINEFEKYVVPGSTALDIGAHIGSHTLTLARLVGPTGRVYAFEPQKKVFRELVFNLRLNEISHAIPLRFAVSSESGILEMDPIRGADGQVGIGEGGDKAEARTIDSFNFSNVSLIKIDVEGHQLPVLEGAERTLRANHPVIIIEIGREQRMETRHKLREYGYRVRRIAYYDFIALHESYEGPGDEGR
jgi:FkbM family methyltransferase